MDITFLKIFYPEIFLSFAILLQLVFNMRLINKTEYNFPIITKDIFFQTMLILTILALLYYTAAGDYALSYAALVNDKSTLTVKFILVLFCIGLTIVIKNSIVYQGINYPEYFSIYLLAIFSMLMMLSCESLASFFIAMEMQALCFYILASFERNSIFSTEAALKYFISGSFVAGFYLLGASIIYGCVGSLNLNALNTLLLFSFNSTTECLTPAVFVGVLLIVFTILFKLACAPFHFWAPDVYEGAPLSSTVIFSILPKLSIFYFFIKYLITVQIYFVYLSELLLVFGVFSTFVGTFFAFRQIRVKKVVIYSSIAQTGFLVSVLSLQTLESISSLYFFLMLYLITSLLIWGHVIMLNYSNTLISKFYMSKVSSLQTTDLSNIFNVHTLFGASILIIFFSIAGTPPFAGFLAKMMILLELIRNKSVLAGIILIFLSAVSVYYYIRFIKVAFFESNRPMNTKPAQVTFFNRNFSLSHILFAGLLFYLVFFYLFSTELLHLCQYIAICMGLI